MEFRSGSIYVRQAPHLLETGHVISGHKHNFDHTTFFGQGTWKVEQFGDVFDGDGKPVMVKRIIKTPNVPDHEIEEQARVKLREVTIRGGAPHSFILIEADKYHTLTLLEGPGTYACVYSHRTHDGDVTPEYTGWNKAYV